MLTDEKQLPASDLWQIGLIIYQLLIGQASFEPTAKQIFQLDFSWPSDLQISEEAKDLVSRLLRLQPSERLGAGPPGTPNDLQQLLKHPYFSELQLSQIYNTIVVLDLPS